MIVSCDINGCKTKWLRLPGGYLRLNLFNLQKGECYGRSLWIKKRMWDAAQYLIPLRVEA